MFSFPDVNTSLKENSYNLLKKLFKEKYGKFKQISNQSNSFIILFPNKYVNYYLFYYLFNY